MKHVMVDLETLGNGSNSVIISIGAVEFDPESKNLGTSFYINVDAQSCVDAGLKIDASTVMWWMKQSEDARKVFSLPSMSLSVALLQFNSWYPAGACFWGNGATFDNVIMSNAYKSVSLKQPWSYSNDRCYRTLKNMYPGVTQESIGTAHNALDDAKYQALHAIKLLNVFL